MGELKVLSIGYYDDFARFFLQIKKELEGKYSNLQFTYYSIYLSGFLYFGLRFQKVTWVSFRVMLKSFFCKRKYKRILKTLSVYKGIDVNMICRYHICLNPSKSLQLKIQALGYIDYFSEKIDKINPDYVILSGDSRMSIEILHALCDMKSVKVFHFEQGPFGTTIFDEKGVNANASIRDVSLSDMEKSLIGISAVDIRNKKKKEKYKRYPFLRGGDFIYQALFKFISFVPVDIQMESTNNSVDTSYENLTSKENDKKKRLLLILQVPYDVNMVYHSPLFNNHFEVVKNTFLNLPEECNLIVREHPLYKGKYESELYKFLLNNNISLDHLDLYESIDKSNVVVVNNSTVGIEAISRRKPVVLLGNSYYDNEEIFLKVHSIDAMNNVLKKAVKFNVDENKVQSFLDYFMNIFLFEGHYRDKELTSPALIVNQIVEYDEA